MYLVILYHYYIKIVKLLIECKLHKKYISKILINIVYAKIMPCYFAKINKESKNEIPKILYPLIS